MINTSIAKTSVSNKIMRFLDNNFSEELVAMKLEVRGDTAIYVFKFVDGKTRKSKITVDKKSHKVIKIGKPKREDFIESKFLKASITYIKYFINTILEDYPTLLIYNFAYDSESPDFTLTEPNHNAKTFEEEAKLWGLDKESNTPKDSELIKALEAKLRGKEHSVAYLENIAFRHELKLSNLRISNSLGEGNLEETLVEEEGLLLDVCRIFGVAYSKLKLNNKVVFL